ncbi:MAG TPA: GNAT family N-acetyltransferase [Chitinophagaceae bacterium]|nr:GNAT family N-acetyltransferase [Chitinophagaceae bacterium]
MVVIRRAQLKDCEAMLELIKELAEFENALEEVTVSLEEFQKYSFGEDQLCYSFVAEKEKRIIGMALCYFRYSTWKGKRLYLEDIVVTNAERGKGIGRKLMEACIAFGKESNSHGMVWQVLDWNTRAIEFYKKYKADFDNEWMNVSINF